MPITEVPRPSRNRFSGAEVHDDISDVELLQHVQGEGLDILAGNLIRLHELKIVLKSIHSRGIQPVALKGLALLQTVYSASLAERPMADLDLLVQPEELAPVQTVLNELGYRATVSGENSFVLQRGKSCTKIDVHTGIWHLSSREVREFIGRSRMVVRNGFALRVPIPEDHLIYIAVHAVLLHGHLRPMWLEDMHRLIGIVLDWEAVLRRGHRARVASPLRLALLQSARIRGSQVPEAAIDGLRTSGGNRWKDRFLQAVLQRGEIPDMGHFFCFLYLRHSKMGALFRYLYPDKKFRQKRYSLGSRPAVLVYAGARPFIALGRTMRLFYRLAAGSTHRTSRNFMEIQ